MQAAQVMEKALDHATLAEHYATTGDLAQARLHRDMAALYVPMARECRIGNARSSTYRDLVFKLVVLAEAVTLVVDERDGDNDFGTG